LTFISSVLTFPVFDTSHRHTAEPHQFHCNHSDQSSLGTWATLHL